MASDAADAADVYKALADGSRRLLLDNLFGAHVQTLGESTAHLPAVTRIGMVKPAHLVRRERLSCDST
jgi:hypothetical protein